MKLSIVFSLLFLSLFTHSNEFIVKSKHIYNISKVRRSVDSSLRENLIVSSTILLTDSELKEYCNKELKVKTNHTFCKRIHNGKIINITLLPRTKGAFGMIYTKVTNFFLSVGR